MCCAHLATCAGSDCGHSQWAVQEVSWLGFMVASNHLAFSHILHQSFFNENGAFFSVVVALVQSHHHDDQSAKHKRVQSVF